jgi:hypothetical protein
MQYPYVISELKPLHIHVDEDGDTQAIYDLPAPIPWFIKNYIGGDYWEESLHMVTRVRIFLATDEFNRPFAGAVPYGEEGREQPISSVHYAGACSITAVLSRMGFEPVLSRN